MPHIPPAHPVVPPVGVGSAREPGVSEELLSMTLESALPETRERRCPSCQSGLIKVERRCEECGTAFLLVRERIH